ncbi:hypothetical protein OPKNFCMD_5208 [Methylobacterium crusticola]|uniref:Pseudouridine synthase n=2 Tax=Methylobacterium crusticola TaxID=1697972 RepID=A0ABQ4R4D3_9HYPH|nr:pseudouridine synthase [Methylobacterium crusticola]GJD52443.1 hypothetical protein OPKNFCMD_5208 [Methylobacterium crusticola]
MSDSNDDETGAPKRRRGRDEASAGTATAGTGPDASAPRRKAAEPAPAAAEPEAERIAKAIARAGLASRRDAEAMILDGRVTLNGVRLDSPAMNVGPEDRITVDGEPLPARERTRLWIFHKPRGVVTTARDPEGRQTVFDVLPDDLPRVVAIGRLDINTEGLLLLTNDGGLAKVIAHPETGWLRRYRVRAFGDVDQAALDRLRGGVTIDGMEYGPIEASVDRAQGDNVWLTLGLREGKNREVKRILEHLGLSVNRLIRLSFGPFQLGDLEVGLVDEIRTRVLKDQLGQTLAEQAGVDFTSPVREPIAPFGSPKAAARAAEAEQGARARPAREGARGRDPARPQFGKPQSAHAATRSAGPPRTVWRDPEAEAAGSVPGRGRVPRRGASPQEARAAAAERPRQRVGAIAAGERRVVVERLVAQPQEEPVPHRRTKFRGSDERDAPRAPRGEGRPARRPRDDGRPPEQAADRREGRGAGARAESSRGGPRAGFSKPGYAKPGYAKPGYAKPGYAKPDHAKPGSSRAGEPAGEGRSSGKPDGTGRGFAGKPSAGKSFGGKSFGSKSFGKSSGGDSSAGRGGEGRAAGDGPGAGRFGGKPGGGKPGGKPGGRAFGKAGYGKPGARPGASEGRSGPGRGPRPGAGGRPGGGRGGKPGGRPPRGA